MRQKQREHSSKGRGQPACRLQAVNGTLTNMHPFLEVAATAEGEISADKCRPSIFGVSATAVAEPPNA
jgi:hypothetical protein